MQNYISFAKDSMLNINISSTFFLGLCSSFPQYYTPINSFC